MPKLKSNCSICLKDLRLKEETPVENGFFRSYHCGHSFFESNINHNSPAPAQNLPSISGNFQSFPFQTEGVEFIRKTGFNCLIADPMGLGKTIQSLLAVREEKDSDGQPKFKSILCIVKPATQYQWFYESKEWFSGLLQSTFLITSPKNFIPPGFRLYILSMDSLARFMKSPAGAIALKALNTDLVIVDECHSFKNPSSARSGALTEFLQSIKPRPGLIMLSGTPIKNRADEYFIPLNLLRPDIFTSLKSFQHNWLTPDDKGKYTRIASRKLESFRQLTKNFILRREKNEVLSLPPFRRAFEHIYIEEETFKKAYNTAVGELEKEDNRLAREGKELSFRDLEIHLMKLRRIIGQAKVPFAIDYTDTFLDTTENEKIAIGIHHESVRDSLYFGLKQKGIKVLKLSGEDSPERKNWVLKQMESDSETRVLIINMIAGGVGLNIQSINNILTIERQWNAADEEQFEARFWRQGQKLPVLNEYLICKGIPVEEWFSDLVERKRLICGESLDGWDLRSDKQALREMIDQTIRTKL